MNKKKLISLSLSAVMSLGMFTTAVHAENPYTDVDEGHWAYEWVNYMHEKGFIHGYPGGEYRPDQYITRAEYVTILNYMKSSTGTTDNNYIDVNEEDWFYGQIHAAVDAGYLHGYNDATDEHDGTMKPNNYITREEAAVVAACAYELALNPDAAADFSDADQISSWAVPYVGALTGDEVLLGDADTHAFRPKDNILRAEVASMLARAHQRDEAGILHKEEIVTLPDALAVSEGAYAVEGITTRNILVEKALAVAVDVVANGEVGAYKINAYLGDVLIAADVTAEGLAEVLKDKGFTTEEIEKLKIEFTGFENPADGSSLTVTVKVSDFATGEKTYDEETYTISFGEAVAVWPEPTYVDKSTNTVTGPDVKYADNLILEITEKTNNNVGTYTVSAEIADTVIAEAVTLEELKAILDAKELTAADLSMLYIEVVAANPAQNSTLELIFKLLDSETKELVGDEKVFKFTFNKVTPTHGSSSGSLSGGGGSVKKELDTTRDRVVESLEDYQEGDVNSSANKKNIYGDKKDYGISEDMLRVILTNDGMNTFDPTVSQVKDAKKVDTVFATLGLNKVAGKDVFDDLYKVYEDIIDYVLDSDKVTYKADDIDTDSKEKYVLLFRAMVATVNGAAEAAIEVYNNNPDKTAQERFDLFKTEAINSTTAALATYISTLPDAEKLAVTELATQYCVDLFEANKGEESFKEDLAALGEVTVDEFVKILKKYAL